MSIDKKVKNAVKHKIRKCKTCEARISITIEPDTKYCFCCGSKL